MSISVLVHKLLHYSRDVPIEGRTWLRSTLEIPENTKIMTWNRYATIDVYQYHIDIDPLNAPTVKAQAKPKDTRGPSKSVDVNRTIEVAMCYKLHLLSDNACINSHALIPPTTKTRAQPTDTRAPFKSDDVNRTNEVGARYVLHYHRLQSRKRITCCLGLSLLGWMTRLYAEDANLRIYAAWP